MLESLNGILWEIIKLIGLSFCLLVVLAGLITYVGDLFGKDG